jgi:hypothetical protein
VLPFRSKHFHPQLPVNLTENPQAVVYINWGESERYGLQTIVPATTAAAISRRGCGTAGVVRTCRSIRVMGAIASGARNGAEYFGA